MSTGRHLDNFWQQFTFCTLSLLRIFWAHKFHWEVGYGAIYAPHCVVKPNKPHFSPFRPRVKRMGSHKHIRRYLSICMSLSLNSFIPLFFGARLCIHGGTNCPSQSSAARKCVDVAILHFGGKARFACSDKFPSPWPKQILGPRAWVLVGPHFIISAVLSPRRGDLGESPK